MEVSVAPSQEPPVSYPNRITRIHQVEVTTLCNLRCVYCPSPKLEQIRGQSKQHMTMEVYEKALDWCAFYRDQGTQTELSITGIGETLLHPDLFTIIRRAREVLPDAFLNFSTNGITLTDEICEHLLKYQVGLFVSLHRPEKAGLAIEMAKKYGIFIDPNGAASVSAFDWAGQVKWFVSAPSMPCDWLKQGWGNVLVDGRITTCCLDAGAKGVICHVDDVELMGEVGVSPFSLCSACHMIVP